VFGRASVFAFVTLLHFWQGGNFNGLDQWFTTYFVVVRGTFAWFKNILAAFLAAI